jgi:hypothetical protein
MYSLHIVAYVFMVAVLIFVLIANLTNPILRQRIQQHRRIISVAIACFALVLLIWRLLLYLLYNN